MGEVDLLRRYPRAKRDITGRASAKTPEIVALAKQFGAAYFDGDRETGYGGYRYDGRWKPVAADMRDHFGLRTGMRLLDVGCAKGFLLRDLAETVPGLEVVGADISSYALEHADGVVAGRLVQADGVALPFEAGAFDVVVSINTVHNLPRQACIEALREIERVGRGRAYVQVDAYRTADERETFIDWMLTAETHDQPAGWKRLFDAAGYSGDYGWTIAE